MKTGIYHRSDTVRTALKLLPDNQPSLKVCRLPPYRLDCSQIGRTRVYGNGWSFAIPREVASIDRDYNAKCAVLMMQDRQIAAGEALTAALLSVYGDWQPERKTKVNSVLAVHVLARQIRTAA